VVSPAILFQAQQASLSFSSEEAVERFRKDVKEHWIDTGILKMFWWFLLFIGACYVVIIVVRFVVPHPSDPCSFWHAPIGAGKC
jgi:hypothetical protein